VCEKWRDWVRGVLGEEEEEEEVDDDDLGVVKCRREADVVAVAELWNCCCRAASTLLASSRRVGVFIAGQLAPMRHTINVEV
jgi:hypothetical protein